MELISSRYDGSDGSAACSGAGKLEAPVVHDVHAVVDVLYKLHQQHSLVRSTATQHSLVRTQVPKTSVNHDVGVHR